jgi:hypothetical protein
MRVLGCWLLVSLALLGTVSAADDKAEFKPLFNGKDLAGWDTYLGKPHKMIEVPDLKKNDKGEYTEAVGLNKDPKKVYTVVTDGGAPAIRVSGEIWGAITTKEEYENYHLRFEVKWGEKKWPPRDKTVRDSGLLYHCVGPHGAGGGFWMKSFESQIQENDFGDFYSVAGVIVDVEGERKGEKGPITFKKGGEKFTGVTSRIIRNPLSEKPHGEWNVVELYAVGQTAVHVNNGKANLVLTGLRHKVDGKEVPLTKGKIQLQSEGAEVFYRKIEIRPLAKIPDELLK